MNALFQDFSKSDSVLVNRIQRDITEEIFRAIKFPRWRTLREIFSPLFRRPTGYFSQLIAATDQMIATVGLAPAVRQLLSRLVGEVRADGSDGIPADGPLIIASNHPGTYDALSLISQLPRGDVKLVVSGIPFFRNLPNASRHFIFATLDTNIRAEAIRQSIRHLRAGGTLLIFPSGRIDPDPAVYPDAMQSLSRWSRSVELFLNRVSGARLVLAITSGVVSRAFIHHPFARLFSNDHERRRVVEFMQVIRQMTTRQPLSLDPRISFASPLESAEITSASGELNHERVLGAARGLLNHHLACYYS